MEPSELYRQVAQLHVENINQGFLSTLGVGFVSLMYRAIDETRGGILLVEERHGRAVGFVAGGLGMGAIYKRMLRHPIRLSLALLPSLLHPRRIQRILEVVRYSGSDVAQTDLPSAELLSIAVDCRHRGQQIADRLYQKLEAHFTKEGISSFKIIVGERLEPAHKFYRRMGAIPVATVQVHKGEKSIVYVQNTLATHMPAVG